MNFHPESFLYQTPVFLTGITLTQPCIILYTLLFHFLSSASKSHSNLPLLRHHLRITCNAGDVGSIPALGRSLGGGHGNPLQYSCLENVHAQRSLEGWAGQLESLGSQRVGHDRATKHSTRHLLTEITSLSHILYCICHL